MADEWQDTDADEEPGEEAEDTLEDLDEETRQRVDAYTARQTRQAQQQAQQQYATARENLQQRGLDLTQDGTVAIRDPSRAAGWLGTPQQTAAVAPAAPVEDEDEEIPDPSLQPREFRQWQQKQIQHGIEQGIKELMQQQQALQGFVVSREVATATERVKSVLPEYGLGSLRDHPEFEERFQEAAANLSPQQLRDPSILVRVAGMLAVDLKPVQQSARQRNAEGQFAPSREAMRADASRVSLSQTAPSREAGGAPSPRQLDPKTQALMEWGGFSSHDEYEAADDRTGTKLRELRRRQQQNARNRSGR